MARLRFTVLHVMSFTGLVAVQVQTPAMISRGFDFTILTIFVAAIGLVASALMSGATDGKLNTDSSPVFIFLQYVLIWCFVNLVISFVLHRMFPPPPYFDV